jgi:beta-carotene 3-hydroxylase
MLFGLHLAIVMAATVAMEPVAYATHRWVMHGIGWRWHRSHHVPGHRGLESNDLYAIVFAAPALALILADPGHAFLYWVGLGITLYGLLYSLLHDGLVHNRLPLRFVPRRGYLRRLIQAHLLHHARGGRDGCVSFGFLYAPPVAQLARVLREGVQ